jgi:hypothetical protein
MKCPKRIPVMPGSMGDFPLRQKGFTIPFLFLAIRRQTLHNDFGFLRAL